MAEFQIAVNKTLNHEGHQRVSVCHNDSNDPGGLTNDFGFALRSHPELGENGIRNMTRDEAVALYRKNYWNSYYDSLHDQHLANALFDEGVNSGVTVAVRLLQLALQKAVVGPIIADGKFGPQTLDAANSESISADGLLRRFTVLRIHRYSQDSDWASAWESWLERALDW